MDLRGRERGLGAWSDEDTSGRSPHILLPRGERPNGRRRDSLPLPGPGALLAGSNELHEKPWYGIAKRVHPIRMALPAASRSRHVSMSTRNACRQEYARSIPMMTDIPGILRISPDCQGLSNIVAVRGVSLRCRMGRWCSQVIRSRTRKMKKHGYFLHASCDQPTRGRAGEIPR